MTLIEALEKTINDWEHLRRTGKYLYAHCQICLCSGVCSSCPAREDNLGFLCIDFGDAVSSDMENKKLICEQAIGYADMLLQEALAKQDNKSKTHNQGETC